MNIRNGNGKKCFEYLLYEYIKMWIRGLMSTN